MGTSLYQRLPTDQSSIRLLSLLPPTSVDDLRLKLKSAVLSEASGNYSAISYTWGPETKTKLAWINGTAVPLRENIWNCLHHLAQSQENVQSYHLWADAICINQDDQQEKESQVRLMGQIFSCADSVLVWLGEASRDHSLGCAIKKHFDWCMHHLRHSEIYEAASQFSVEGLIYTENGNLIPNMLNIALTVSGMVKQNPGSSHPLRENISWIFQSEYWNRLWIVQELLLARHAWIILGPHLLNFRSDLQILKDLSARELGIEIPQPRDMLMFSLSSRQAMTNKDRLSDALRTYQDQRCSDPRDRVYGLLGVVEEEGVWNIDYSSSREELCLRTIAYFHGIHRQDLTPDHLDHVDANSILQALGVPRDSLRVILSAPQNSNYAPADLCFGRRYQLQIKAYSVLSPVDHEEENSLLTDWETSHPAAQTDRCVDHYQLFDLDSGSISEHCFPRSDFMSDLGHRFASDDPPGSNGNLLECEIRNKDLLESSCTFLLRRHGSDRSVTAEAASFGYGSVQGSSVRRIWNLDQDKVHCLTKVLQSSEIDWDEVWRGQQISLTASCAESERPQFEDLNRYLGARPQHTDPLLDQERSGTGEGYSSWYSRHRAKASRINLPSNQSGVSSLDRPMPFMSFEEVWSAMDI